MLIVSACGGKAQKTTTGSTKGLSLEMNDSIDKTVISF